MEVWRQLVDGKWSPIRFSQERPLESMLLGLGLILAAWLSRIILSAIALVLIIGSAYRAIFRRKRKTS